ncbi:MAG: hypothetical protein JXO22_01495 [Phycisphaerae bacterium]|nr:hypothetical protein [Phycisphaerae bacterium]
MTDAQGQTERSIDVDRRAAARTMQTRQRRIIRNLVTFAIAVTVMLMLSLAHRDSQAVRAYHDGLAHLPAALKDALAHGGLPANLPPPPGLSTDEVERWRDRLLYLRDNVKKIGDHKRVAVVYMDHPLNLFLRADGRHLILYDGKEFERVWMTEREVRERKDELAIYLGPDK